MKRNLFGRPPFTRRQFLGSSAATLAAVGTMTAMPRAGRADDELNILVWCDHTDDRLLQPFAEKHNVTINVKDYQETGAALAILEQSQPGDWDILVVDSVDVARVAERGLLSELKAADMPWGDVFPELQSEGPAFRAEGLGHPLIPVARCVRNDVALGGERRALMMSGSNMSGKSTLLRSVGLACVMALAGLPVRARRLALSPLQVAASIRISDSTWASGSGRFKRGP